MINYALLKCYMYTHRKKYFLLPYNGYIDKNQRNKIISSSPPQCPECGRNLEYPHAIVSSNDKLIAVEYTVSSFKVFNGLNKNILLSPKDNIRIFLEQENFNDISFSFTYNDIIMRRSDGITAIFATRNDRKTQDLILCAPTDHPLFNQLKNEVSIANKLKRANAAPPKPKVKNQFDIFSDSVIVNDWVAFVQDNRLKIGKIIKINEKSVTIVDIQSKRKFIGKIPSQIIKLTKDKALLMMLEN
jgi:hypothetical protein